MDPHSGRVLAIAGGFSFAQSQFDRATQARRQPGSSFKPLIYTVALDNGYTPSSIIVDGPICLEQGAGMPQWCPKNYDAGSAAGPSTLRFGIEKSRNLMTVRLARDMGMPIIAEYSRRFGVYDNLMPALSMALGAGETTLLRMVTGYSMLCNGGKQVKASFVDRVQDRYGRTVWRHDGRDCSTCAAREWSGQAGARARRQSHAGHRPDVGIPDDLDHGGRRPERHGAEAQGSEAADRGQDRHDQRL